MLRIESVVVTGGRKFNDAARIEADIAALVTCGLCRLADGECPYGGADQLAFEAWLCSGSNGDGVRYPMRRDLDGPGRGAYLRRNTRMLETERPGIVLAYPDQDSRGTWHCCGEALRLGAPVAIWHPFCTSADLLDPRRTNGHLIDGRGMARLAIGRARTLYVPVTNPDAVREWIALFAALG